jgi:hypothetical protein
LTNAASVRGTNGSGGTGFHDNVPEKLLQLVFHDAERALRRSDDDKLDLSSDALCAEVTDRGTDAFICVPRGQDD